MERGDVLGALLDVFRLGGRARSICVVYVSQVGLESDFRVLMLLSAYHLILRPFK